MSIIRGGGGMDSCLLLGVDVLTILGMEDSISLGFGWIDSGWEV